MARPKGMNNATKIQTESHHSLDEFQRVSDSKAKSITASRAVFPNTSPNSVQKGFRSV